ncbi:transcriptional regulator [Xanthomonas citri pv. citri str. 306]|uniref:Transcriptional regulator n=6 Tax=Xanthomonas TaxID=338 RepID=A0AAI8ESK7_XANAC|nr:transcriptional regulator [Xanthomonas citri pv. citri str. 306]
MFGDAFAFSRFHWHCIGMTQRSIERASHPNCCPWRTGASTPPKEGTIRLTIRGRAAKPSPAPYGHSPRRRPMAPLIAVACPDTRAAGRMHIQASRVRAVARAMQYIDTHLYEPVSVAHLAQAACMSRFHFARVFRDAVGASPMEYLRLRRLERAQAMLREGGHTISQIATDLCFFDQSHFVRSFRNATGCTPARFAAQMAMEPCGAALMPSSQRRGGESVSLSMEQPA